MCVSRTASTETEFFEHSKMLLVNIFLFCFFGGAVLANNNTENGTVYEYKFRPARYIKDAPPNITTLPDARLHICRLPNEERVKICKGALEDEFALDNHIEYRDDMPLGEEKMIEVKLSGVYYEWNLDNAPIFVSACMCPTAPPIYLKDESTGTDVRVYVDLHFGEDEHGFTKSWKNYSDPQKLDSSASD